MSKQGQSGDSDGRAAGGSHADPRDVKERTEQKEMHSRDAHEAAKERKPAQTAQSEREPHKR